MASCCTRSTGSAAPTTRSAAWPRPAPRRLGRAGRAADRAAAAATAATGPRRRATSMPRCCCGPTARSRPARSCRSSPAWRSPRRSDAMRRRSVAAQLKWPNDVLIGGAKTAGILLESAGQADGGRPPWMIVGIGREHREQPRRHALSGNSLVARGLPAVTPRDLLGGYLRGARSLARPLAHGRFRRGARKPGCARSLGLGEQIRAAARSRGAVRPVRRRHRKRCLAAGADTGGRREIAAGDVFYPGR